MKEVDSVVGEEIGCTGQVIESGLDFRIESVESSIGGTSIVNDSLGGYLCATLVRF